LISVAHEEGKLNDLRAILGNDVAIKASREGKLPYPDGTIIARLAWSYDPLEESEKAFAVSNLSWPGNPRTEFNSWSRTQENTPQPAAGGSLTLTTANPPTRRCTTPAFPATRPSKLAIDRDMSENQIVESSFTAIINASTAPSGVSDNSPAGSTTCLSRYALIADADQVHSAMYPGSIFGPLFTPPLTSLRRGAERGDSHGVG
jgi:hypothetical protein